MRKTAWKVPIQWRIDLVCFAWHQPTRSLVQRLTRIGERSSLPNKRLQERFIRRGSEGFRMIAMLVKKIIIEIPNRDHTDPDNESDKSALMIEKG